jgi:hypothetical protein
MRVKLVNICRMLYNWPDKYQFLKKKKLDESARRKGWGQEQSLNLQLAIFLKGLKKRRRKKKKFI